MVLSDSKLVDRIVGERVAAWDIHHAALTAKAKGEYVTILSVGVADIASRITPRTRAVFFANPCNSTGANVSESDLKVLAELAIRHDLWVVMDEMYRSICFETLRHSPCSFPGMAARCHHGQQPVQEPCDAGLADGLGDRAERAGVAHGQPGAVHDCEKIVAFAASVT